MNLRKFLQQNKEEIESSDFEIYSKHSGNFDYDYYEFEDSLNSICSFDELQFAEKIKFFNNDGELQLEISLDEEFQVDGGDGDWHIENKDWSIYV